MSALSVLSIVAVCLLYCVGAADDPDWWKTATVYQIYPRSYKDTTGDGIGDLQGIKQKAAYLRDLGISAVWLSPIYKSPQKDFGYDISNYTQVDPVYGTNQDLVDLINELKSVGVKLLLDYVPNHTSDEHEWFLKSVDSDPMYKDFYVWRNKSGDDTVTKLPIPPNNWQSVFGGSAWKWNDKRQQFYLHDFVEGQPDLNYDNPAVVEATTNNLIFWMKQGVDGFRFDAVPFLFEDQDFKDEPVIDVTQPLSYDNLYHIYTQNQPKTYELLKNWSSVIDSFSKSEGKSRLMFMEAYASLSQTANYYVGPDFAMPFNFILFGVLDQNKNATDFFNAINTWTNAIPAGAISNWVVGNHDNRRITTRMGVEFADALNMFLALMPGIMVTYNGEELAMEDTFVRWNETVDPSGLLLGEDNYLKGTRDPERTPMQWDTSENAGFTNVSKPWLPINPNYWRLNALAQQAADKSHLKVYQRMLAAKKTPTLKEGSFNMKAPNDWTLIIERTLEGNDTYVGIINFGSELMKPDLSVLSTNETNFVIYTSSLGAGFDTGDVVKRADSLVLRPKAAVVLCSNGAATLVYSLTAFLALIIVVAVQSC